MVVFPGGDYDVYRPTLSENKIDFDGRTGYVRAALNAGVPIVPTVSIGGQESQLYLSRGEWLAKALRLDKLLRVKILPISFGFPFGLSAVLPVNVPLPTKIVMQVLPPIDIVAEFGEDPDIDEVDAHVRHVMQQALDELAKRTPPPGDRLSPWPSPTGSRQTLGIVAHHGPRRPHRADAARQVRADGRGDAARRTWASHRVSRSRRSAARTGPGLVDELGTLTWRELDQRADALAAALQATARRPTPEGRSAIMAATTAASSRR